MRRREIGVGEFVHMMQASSVEYRLGRHRVRGRDRALGAAALRAGRPRTSTRSASGSSGRRSSDLIYPEMRELVRAHQRRGHTVVLSSSALTSFQAEPVARYLGIDHVLCNRFVVDEHGAAHRRGPSAR